MSGDTDRRAENYGFIGLGAMGYWKIPAGSTIYVHDVVAAPVQRFVNEAKQFGPIICCLSAQEVVENSQVILTIVPEGKHVLQVYATTGGGALQVADVTGKIFIDCSTIDMATSRDVADQVKSRGATFVDAPVSGGTTGAKAGSITFMIGIDERHKLKARIEGVLATMGKNLFVCGGPTLGLAAKLCNNYISGTIAIATSEGMNLAMRLGLNPKVFSDVLAVSTGGSWVNAKCNPVPGVVPDAPASHEYAPGFKVQLMRKDYNLAVEAAKSCGAKLYLGPVGLQVYTGASEDPECIHKDARVVFRYIGGNEHWQS